MQVTWIHALLALSILCAVIEWVAVEKRWRKLEYFAKPGVMILLIAWLLLSGSLAQPNLAAFTLGAFFSLLGDIFLLLQRERLGFILGLGAFLLAHLCYIYALYSPLAPAGMPAFTIAAMVLLLSVWLGSKLFSGLRRKGLKSLVFPVFLYILTISVMLLGALTLAWRSDWMLLPAVLVGLGAVSFTISDSLLSWNKFVNPVRHGRLFLMISYHLGQMAILGGALLQFG